MCNIILLELDIEQLNFILLNLLQVIRGGRTINMSIFDIVVGDVVPLKIGDQVSLYGIFEFLS